MKYTILLVASYVMFISTNSANAHVVLQDQAALANTSYRAAFRVGHGCNGSPTTAIKVALPAGFRGAKPMPHAGWRVVATSEKLAQPYKSHGKDITHDVTQVTWTANSPADALPDSHYDEFVLRGSLPDAGGPIWFKIWQTCEVGANNWVEVPASGTSTQGLKSPAALLEVIPSGPAGQHQH